MENEDDRSITEEFELLALSSDEEEMGPGKQNSQNNTSNEECEIGHSIANEELKDYKTGGFKILDTNNDRGKQSIQTESEKLENMLKIKMRKLVDRIRLIKISKVKLVFEIYLQDIIKPEERTLKFTLSDSKKIEGTKATEEEIEKVLKEEIKNIGHVVNNTTSGNKEIMKELFSSSKVPIKSQIKSLELKTVIFEYLTAQGKDIKHRFKVTY